MNIKKAAFLKKNPNIEEIQVPITVLIDKETGNVFFIDDSTDIVYDRYIYLTDPGVVEGKIVNCCSRDTRRKYQRRSIAVAAAAFLDADVLIKVEDKWKNIQRIANKTLLKWFPFLDL